MGTRFRKRIKIGPGVYVNLSKGAPSVSVGRRGATFNLSGKRGSQATLGIPGSGVSYSAKLSQKRLGYWIAVLLLLCGVAAFVLA